MIYMLDFSKCRRVACTVVAAVRRRGTWDLTGAVGRSVKSEMAGVVACPLLLLLAAVHSSQPSHITTPTFTSSSTCPHDTLEQQLTAAFPIHSRSNPPPPPPPPHTGDAGEQLTATTKDMHSHQPTTRNGQARVSSAFTIVSALLDLGREQWPYFRRSFDAYLTYSVQLLQLDVPLVAYVDARTEQFVRLSRRGKEHMTVLHTVRLQDLALYAQYQQVHDVMHSDEFKHNNLLLQHPEGFSPDYNILMNSKASMLLETSRRNYFNSTHFFWMDMGYGHGNDVYPADNQWTPHSLIADTSNRVTFIAVNNLTLVKSIFDIYKKRVGPGVNGGFFGGSRRAVAIFHDVHKYVFNDFIRSSMMDDDQTVTMECYLRYPYLFNIVKGGWYDVFKLFS